MAPARRSCLSSGWPFDSRSWEPQVHPLLEAGYRVIALRPPRLRPVEPADRGLRLRHPRRRPRQAPDRARPARRHARRLLARHRRAYPLRRLHGTERLNAWCSSRAWPRRSPNPPRTRKASTRRRSTASSRPSSTTAPPGSTALLGDFLNLDDYLGKRVSEETVRSIWNAGAGASPYATWACPLTWLDDYEEDIKRIDIPTLILHGTADRILSIEGQGRRLHAALPDAKLRRDRRRPPRHVRHPRRGGQPRAPRVPRPRQAIPTRR